GGFFFSSRRRHTRFSRDWSSDVCSSDLGALADRAWQAADAEVGPAPRQLLLPRAGKQWTWPARPSAIEPGRRDQCRPAGRPAAEIGRAAWRERGEVSADVDGCEEKKCSA